MSHRRTDTVIPLSAAARKLLADQDAPQRAQPTRSGDPLDRVGRAFQEPSRRQFVQHEGGRRVVAGEVTQHLLPQKPERRFSRRHFAARNWCDRFPVFVPLARVLL